MPDAIQYLHTEMPSKSADAPSVAPRSRLSIGACIWLVLLTLATFAAFIMAAWATGAVHQIQESPVAVFAKASDIPKNYDVFPLGYGSGMWSKEADMLHGRSDHGVSERAWGRAAAERSG